MMPLISTLLIQFRNIAIATLLVTTAFSLTIHAENLQKGQSFTDPDDTIQMPDEWLKQPLKYNNETGKADIVISLDQHLHPALLPFIHNYETIQGVNIRISEGTCGISSGKLARKEMDVGGFCCPPAKTDRLPGLSYHTVGIAALGLLVNSSNNIDNVTLKEAREIFAGQILNWSELKDSTGKNGPDLPIQPVTRLHCKLRPGHWKLLLGHEDLFALSALEVGHIPDMISTVARNVQTIGFEVLWNLSRYNSQDAIKALKINGHSPYDREALISGDYPLYRAYNITTWEDKDLLNQKAQELVAFLLKQAENISPEHGIISSYALRKSGNWQFKGTELIGGPENAKN